MPTVELKTPTWGVGDMAELVRMSTPLLRAQAVTEPIGANVPFLSERLTPLFTVSNIRITVALWTPDNVYVRISKSDTEDELLALNAGMKLGPFQLYSFDVPLSEGLAMNIEVPHDNTIAYLMVTETGVLA